MTNEHIREAEERIAYARQLQALISRARTAEAHMARLARGKTKMAGYADEFTAVVTTLFLETVTASRVHGEQVTIRHDLKDMPAANKAQLGERVAALMRDEWGRVARVAEAQLDAITLPR